MARLYIKYISKTTQLDLSSLSWPSRLTRDYFSAPCIVPKVQQGRIVVSIDDSGLNSTATEVKPSLIEISIVKHGTQVIVECENRYEPSNNSSPVTCNNGTWSYIPKCQPGTIFVFLCFLFSCTTFRKYLNHTLYVIIIYEYFSAM